MNKYITRVAPSPTGDMHLGTARCAYFNWLAARGSGGHFILRIDDTDVERNNQKSIIVIHETMVWLGLKPDITFRQSTRGERYAEVAERLIRTGSALRLADGAIALRWNNSWPVDWHDEVLGRMRIDETNISQINGTVKGREGPGLVLLRGGDKIGQATYQFASAVDDYDYGVNFIIRGCDHTSNTPKQLAVWHAMRRLSYQYELEPIREIPKFAHIGLIYKDGKKLSKRDNAASMLHYRDGGYKPEAMLNFMLRLGWGPKEDNKENNIMDKFKAIDFFLAKGAMRKADRVNFDDAKLTWYNNYYIKEAKKK